MPVYKLTSEISFPHPFEAEDDGLLCFGGDLSAERLLLAYSHGIFPWYSAGDPILWWSPSPRCVLFPEKLKVSKSLRQTLRNSGMTVRFDTCFATVMQSCGNVVRKDEGGTWITPEMLEAYCSLHEMGLAHSVEVFKNEDLVGGLYGVALGRVFYGESMFHTVSNASKVALYYLVERLKAWNFRLIDSQVKTDHIISMGAEEIDRKLFYDLIQTNINIAGHYEKWTEISEQ